MNSKLMSGSALLLGGVSLFAYSSYRNQVWAAAKKPPTPTTSCTAASTSAIAAPKRPVYLRPIGTKAFQLPNGSAADINLDMQTMLNTSVTALSQFSPSDPPSTANPCAGHLELRSSVTDFELNLTDFNISIGFSPTGPLNGITGVTGQANVQIGNISMAFSLWNCAPGVPCQSVSTSTANHKTVGANLSLTANFSMISTGTSLLINTPLGSIMTSIMNKGITNLAQATNVNLLPWTATVTDYLPSAGLLTLNVGNEAGIGTGQNFEIYAPVAVSTPVPGVSTVVSCTPSDVVAYVQTQTVNQLSSLASITQVMGNGPQIGDIVTIHLP